MSNEDDNRTSNTPSNMESVIKDALSKTNGGKFGDRPVCIHIHSVRKRLADPDGVSAKAAIDGIVKSGLLADDNSEIIKSVTFTQEKGDPEKTIITITDE